MGVCNSSNDKNQAMLNNTGPGLPPQEIIPQPVEVSNLEPDINTKIINQDDPLNKLDSVENQQINSMNTAINTTNIQGDPTLNVSNPNINNSLPLNQNLANSNISLNLDQNNQNFNTSVTLNQNENTNMNNSNNQNNLNNSNTNLGQTKLIKSNYPNNLGNTQITVGSQGQRVIYNPQIHNSQQVGGIVQPSKIRMYLVVQLPQREIEITKLYDYNCLIDIEPFIAPDSIDEYDFYDARGYSIDDYLYTPFYEWHNIYRTLRIKLVRSGLHIANDIRNYISKNTYLIGCLTFDKPNTFGLFLFNKTNNSTLSFEYSTNIYLQMKTVNQFSAYCNALNKLYISGGEILNNQATDSFICVDLNELEQNIFVPSQLCSLKKRRYWHSMIFIPENYIFIIGGPNEVDVELYDINKNIIEIDSQLNTERCEPSLILVNNKFLYAIFGFHLYESFINTIERCNIHKRRREWENVEYKLGNTPNLVRGFFGVTYVGNNILLVSDKENQNDLKPNYILIPGKGNIDTINEEGILNSRSSRLFAEKFFIPFSENESMNLAFKSGEPKIFIVNNDNGGINELCISES